MIVFLFVWEEAISDLQNIFRPGRSYRVGLNGEGEVGVVRRAVVSEAFAGCGYT